MRTKILSPDSYDDMQLAGEILRSGGLVAIPTETVYGLAANALNPEAVKNIYVVKGRPSDNPLIVHINNFEDMKPLVREIPKAARLLAAAFWPGPLTIILPKTDIIPDQTSGGLDTVAIRFPSHPVARAIIAAAKCPLAAPSANLSGKPSPTEFRYVFDDLFGKVEAIVDGGDCEVGVESTVITLATPVPKVLRPGGITVEQLREVLGEVEVDDAVINKLKDNEEAASPGMKYKHYSPAADITIADVSLEDYVKLVDSEEGAAALCFEGEEELIKAPSVTFGKEYDGESQAQRLFAALNELDEKGLKKVYARCPKRRDVGLAVYNRLIRSAGFNVIKPEFTIMGLTGPTGAGKSTVAQEFIRRGAAVVDCDALSKSSKVYDEYCIAELQANFGFDIAPQGVLDRRELARRAFSDPEGKAKLEKVVFPYIMAAIRAEIDCYKAQGKKLILLDAPTLFEAKADRLCSKILVVNAPELVRLDRIVKRDKISTKDALLRIKAQMRPHEFLKRADFVIDNSGEKDIARQVSEILDSGLV